MFVKKIDQISKYDNFKNCLLDQFYDTYLAHADYWLSFRVNGKNCTGQRKDSMRY